MTGRVFENATGEKGFLTHLSFFLKNQNRMNPSWPCLFSWIFDEKQVESLWWGIQRCGSTSCDITSRRRLGIDPEPLWAGAKLSPSAATKQPNVEAPYGHKLRVSLPPQLFWLKLQQQLNNGDALYAFGWWETDVGRDSQVPCCRMSSFKISVDSSLFLLQYMGNSRCIFVVRNELTFV